MFRINFSSNHILLSSEDYHRGIDFKSAGQVERDLHVTGELKKTANWLKIEDSPVVTSQGRVARAPWRLRIIGSGYRKLRAANRLLARLLRTRSYLKRRAGRGSCSYGPRRPAKIQIQTNQWLARWKVSWLLSKLRWNPQLYSTVTYYCSSQTISFHFLTHY